ncbi:Protein GVQW3 like protein [Argiope bruennichi]|uniref:Protein GVQW3 like protein n=1 Tax=Argiope bruennichi TaxID=94029 RepID=A0A8T0FKH0_ARGBR|nr:Protein GVQW3 like protein [Argiope bruennichi]
MLTVYGKDCVSDKSVRKWNARFRVSRESLVDDPRPGQTNTVVTAYLIDKVDDLLRSDRHVTLRMLGVKAYVSLGTVSATVHDRLRYRKVCVQWVPKQLTDQHFNICFGIMKTPLSWSGSPQLQIYGYNSDLFSNFSEALALCRSDSIVAIAVLIQIGNLSNDELRILSSQLSQIVYRGK